MNYELAVMEKIRTLVPDVPVFEIGVPLETRAPRRLITVAFSTPTWSRAGSGIVNARKDIHRVQCSVRVDSPDARDASEITETIFWGLTGWTPPNCGEMRASVSGTWGRIEGQTRPSGFSQGTIFYFNTNLEVR